jgi:hypothetical protein
MSVPGLAASKFSAVPSNAEAAMFQAQTVTSPLCAGATSAHVANNTVAVLFNTIVDVLLLAGCFELSPPASEIGHYLFGLGVPCVGLLFAFDIVVHHPAF